MMSAIESRGWTLVKLAEVSGVSYHTVCKVNKFQPISLKSQVKIATVLRIDLHDLFPEELYREDFDTEMRKTYDKEQVGQLIGVSRLLLEQKQAEIQNPEESLIRKERMDYLLERLDTDRERQVAAGIASGQTLKEIGESFDSPVSVERVRQIEAKLMKRLRHSSSRPDGG